jgi:SAM-dependent methyltransferase
MRGALRRRLARAAGERAMDLGCGTGLHTEALAPTERTITAVDPSPAMLAQILQHAGEDRIYPVCATAQEIASGQVELPEPAYDVILAKEVLHHVPDRDRADVIAGLGRLLAPGGRLLVAMLPTVIGYPLWPRALERFTALQPVPQDIALAMEAAGLAAEVTYDSFPLAFTRDRYLGMVRARYMSLLSHYDDRELENGIAQILQEHGDAGEFIFADRFAFVLGRAGA